MSAIWEAPVAVAAGPHRQHRSIETVNKSPATCTSRRMGCWKACGGRADNIWGTRGATADREDICIPGAPLAWQR